MTTASLEFLTTLEDIIASRKQAMPDDSYTSQLFAAGAKRIAQKVGEEAVEVALAASSGNRDETLGESADLLYHLLVLLADQEISLSQVVDELASRHTK